MSIFATDAFTDTDATLLHSHTPTGGGFTWSNLGANDCAIYSNQLSVNGVADDHYAWASATPPSADYYVQATIVVPATPEGHWAVLARWNAGGGNWYQFKVDKNAGTAALIRYDSYTPTTLASASYTPTTGDVGRIEVQGSTLRGKVNGTTVVTATDSTYGSAGNAGVHLGTPTSIPNALGMDNFEAGTLGAADTTPPVVSSASVNAAGTTLTIAFTETGSPPVLPASGVTGFTLTASGGGVTLSSTAISSTTFTATTSRTILSGETLTLAYAPGNVTDSAATPNAMTSFSGTAVTNNSTQAAPSAPVRPLIVPRYRVAPRPSSALLTARSTLAPQPMGGVPRPVFVDTPPRPRPRPVPTTITNRAALATIASAPPRWHPPARPPSRRPPSAPLADGGDMLAAATASVPRHPGVGRPPARGAPPGQAIAHGPRPITAVVSVPPPRPMPRPASPPPLRARVSALTSGRAALAPQPVWGAVPRPVLVDRPAAPRRDPGPLTSRARPSVAVVSPIPPRALIVAPSAWRPGMNLD